MDDRQVMLITGSRKGIGRYLSEYYVAKQYRIIGCSREHLGIELLNYEHYCLDVSDEEAVKGLFASIRKKYGRLDVLINNAGIASMNHILLTPVTSIINVLNTNVIGTLLFSREAAKIMRKNKYGRIVNFSTIAVPLRLEGEAVYVASKAAIVSLTQVLAYELSDFGITVNAVGPTPIKTDLVNSIPKEKMEQLIARQAVKRWGEFRDITNVIDFFISPKSDFISGQVLYLGGIS